jgi:5'-deoxynucleotidase YfbR-like HD superfamily hydrolase
MNTPSHGFWIQTHSGMAFDLLNPLPGMVVLDDIAWALSNLNRFTGHAARPYSVAEHSINVAARVSNDFCDATTLFTAERVREQNSLCLAALLHDAEEAYLGDLSSPFKALLRNYTGHGDVPAIDQIAGKIKTAIALHFHTDILRPSSYSKNMVTDTEAMSLRKRMIKQVDLRMLATERRDLMPKEPAWDACSWMAATGHPPPVPYDDLHISADPNGWHRENDWIGDFMHAFRSYGGKR